MSVTKRRAQKRNRAENVRRYLCALGIRCCWVKELGSDCGHTTTRNEQGSAGLAPLIASLVTGLALIALAVVGIAHLALPGALR